jgi:hypothetical protein
VIEASGVFPELTWRVFPCYGGWYWESFCGGVKVNGGIAADGIEARLLGRRHAFGDRWVRAELLPAAR